MTKIISRMSIRSRFITLVVMMALFAAFIFYVFPSIQYATSLNALQDKAVSAARMLAFNLAAALQFDDREPVLRAFKGALTDEDVSYVVVWDADGDLFAADSREGEAPQMSFRLAADFESEREGSFLKVRGPVVNLRGNVAGTIGLAMSTEKVERQYRQNLLNAFLFSVGVAIVASVVVYLFGRQIASPITTLAATTDRIAREDMTVLASEAKLMADGDLTRKVRLEPRAIPVQTSDEVGQLASSFNSMLEKLREIADSFTLVSSGLRETVLHVQSAADEVAAGSDTVASATDLAARRNESTVNAVEGMAATIHEMNANIQGVARRAQSQAATSAEVLASIENMLRSVQTVAGVAEQLVDIAQGADLAVTKGRDSMTSTTRGIGKIRDVIHSSATLVQELGGMAEDIGKIVGVIDDIAEQTNLLSLNAAIEAARAGEHGLGFAVVAEEVRKLAERSAKSTDEISTLIGGIQSQVRKVVQHMDESTSIVDEGMQHTDELVSNLEAIDSAVAEVTRCSSVIGKATAEQSSGTQQIEQATARLSELTQEITASTEEQSTGTAQVVETIEEIRQMVQENAAGAGELASSAGELTRQAASMRELASRFTVGTRSSG